jgi:uracil-DNA glycosylase
VFTGDRSGDWLYGALHRAGFANQAASSSRDDGMSLTDAYVSVVVRCAPPDNAPTTTERDRCVKYLAREVALLGKLQAIVALGGFAWDGALLVAGKLDIAVPKPRPKFGHGAASTLGPWQLFGSYHVSQQNTFTGKLTEAMLDDVFSKARASLH